MVLFENKIDDFLWVDPSTLSNFINHWRSMDHRVCEGLGIQNFFVKTDRFVLYVPPTGSVQITFHINRIAV